MKKIISLLTVLSLAFAALFSFAACAPDSTNDDTSVPEGDPYTPELTVTRAEWDKAMNFLGYTNFEYVQTATSPANEYVANMTIKVTENLIYVMIDFGVFSFEDYFQREGDVYYDYHFNGTDFVRTEVESYYFIGAYKDYLALATVLEYKDFTFDEASGSYKATKTGATAFHNATDATVVMNDGKVVSYEYTEHGGRISATASYGNTTLEIPEFIVEE